jgi:hypothetical protein
MNGRERLIKALSGQPTDRVPIAPFLYYNSVYEMFKYRPQIETFFNPPDFDPIEKFVAYCDYFALMSTHPRQRMMWVGNTMMDRRLCNDKTGCQVDEKGGG